MRTLNSFLVVLCVSSLPLWAQAESDPFQWLEEVESEKALSWVKTHNAATLKILQADPNYKVFLKAAQDILNAKDRIPYGSLRGQYIYNFWQDAKHVRGIWRRTKPKSYQSKVTKWETVLDFDALAKEEKENWVYKGVRCLAPKFERCMIRLSRGGKDASVYREFDIPSKSFVTDGFYLKEAKSSVGWIDKDTLFVGTDFGPGTTTESGYPRMVKKWSRGTDLSQAKLVFEGEPIDMGIWPVVSLRPEGRHVFVYRSMTFFTSALIHVADDGKQTKLPLQPSAQLKGLFHGQVLINLREAWTPIKGGQSYAVGTLLSIPLAELLANEIKTIHSIYVPTKRTSVQAVSAIRSDVYVSVLDNVRGRLIRYTFDAKKGAWVSHPVALPQNGAVGLTTGSPFADDVFIRFTDFTTPDQLYSYSRKTPKPTLLKSLPKRFDASGVKVEQHQVKSKDGEMIPYFLVRPKGAKGKSALPTLLYGYGGFEISMTPRYMTTFGKLWLERGGAFAIANIRGGGEFGPRWHKAAKKQNRQRAFDDFIAIGQDLVNRKVTDSKRLAIMGGSNGGLLMGASFTQRPDLFKAVVCQVPLLDMIRYTKLLAGASWAAEYGDPEEASMRAAILKYSPYHNIKADKTYPQVFFITSTKDDRVHPGHARKMAAKMLSMGKPVYYFENIEGGHSASANRNQRAKRTALEFVYLWQQLSGKAPAPPLIPTAQPAVQTDPKKTAAPAKAKPAEPAKKTK